MDKRILDELKVKSFWDNSPLGKVQSKQSINLKDYEKCCFDFLRENSKSDQVLIVGVGAGREISGIIEKLNPKKLVLLDLSTNLLEQCKKNVERLKISDTELNIEYVAMDFLKYPEKDKFDLIFISNNTMAYIDVSKERNFILGQKLISLTLNGSHIMVEVPNLNRWGLKAFFVYPIMFLFSFYKRHSSLMPIKSGHYFSYYRNYTMFRLCDFFSELGFHNKLLFSKSEFRKYENRGNKKNDTLIGIFEKFGKD